MFDPSLVLRPDFNPEGAFSPGNIQTDRDQMRNSALLAV